MPPLCIAVRLHKADSPILQTGWTRFVLSLPPNFHSPSSSLPDPPLPDILAAHLPAHYHEVLGPHPLPQVTIKQTHANVTTHLDGLKRTKGGVGSEQYDARQKSLRDFFSGASSSDSSATESGKEEAAESTNGTNGTPRSSKPVPDPRPIDLTGDDKDDVMKTNGEHQRRGVRLTSPTSPSPKKSRLS